MAFNVGNEIYTTSDVHVRASASTSAAIVDTVKANSTLGNVESTTTDSAGYTWYNIGEGWVRDGSYIVSEPPVKEGAGGANPAQKSGGNGDSSSKKTASSKSGSSSGSGSSIVGPVIGLIAAAIALWAVWKYVLTKKTPKK